MEEHARRDSPQDKAEASGDEAAYWRGYEQGWSEGAEADLNEARWTGLGSSFLAGCVGLGCGLYGGCVLLPLIGAAPLRYALYIEVPEGESAAFEEGYRDGYWETGASRQARTSARWVLVGASTGLFVGSTAFYASWMLAREPGKE